MALTSSDFRDTRDTRPPRREVEIAGLKREAEMVARNPRLSDAKRAETLAAISREIEARGGDTSDLPRTGGTSSENRSTRTSKQAGARSKRGPGRPPKAKPAKSEE